MTYLEVAAYRRKLNDIVLLLAGAQDHHWENLSSVLICADW